MEMSERFKWSSLNLTLRQFMDHFGHVLPQIVMVTGGYSGREDQMHQIGADEIYWVQERMGEPRVLLRDQRGRCNSVPLDDQSMFQLLKQDGRMTGDLPLKTALRKYRHNKDFIQFSNNKPVVTSVGAECSHKQRLGLMSKLDEYDQQYILVHHMIDDEIMPQRSAIPLYVPITVEVAVGFNFSIDQTFKEFLYETAQLVSKLDSAAIQKDTVILQFDEEPEGDYSYAKPLFMKNEDTNQAALYTELDKGTIQQATASVHTQKKQSAFPQDQIEEPLSEYYKEIDDDILYDHIDDIAIPPEEKNIRRSQTVKSKPEVPPKPRTSSQTVRAASFMAELEVKLKGDPCELSTDAPPLPPKAAQLAAPVSLPLKAAQTSSSTNCASSIPSKETIAPTLPQQRYAKPITRPKATTPVPKS